MHIAVRPAYYVTWGGRLEFASLWLLFQQDPFISYFSSMKAKKCLESATVLKRCLLIAYLSSMEIGAHSNQENQLANLVLALF